MGDVPVTEFMTCVYAITLSHTLIYQDIWPDIGGKGETDCAV